MLGGDNFHANEEDLESRENSKLKSQDKQVELDAYMKAYAKKLADLASLEQKYLIAIEKIQS